MGVRNPKREKRTQSNPELFRLESPKREADQSFPVTADGILINVMAWKDNRNRIEFFVFNFKVKCGTQYKTVASIDCAHGSIHIHHKKKKNEVSNLDTLVVYSEDNWKQTIDEYYEQIYDEYVINPRFHEILRKGCN